MATSNRFDRLEEILMEGFSEEEVLLAILDELSEQEALEILDAVEDSLLSEREAEGEDDEDDGIVEGSDELFDDAE
jgi:uncharacterized protein YfbU (UPF0304 family)